MNLSPRIGKPAGSSALRRFGGRSLCLGAALCLVALLPVRAATTAGPTASASLADPSIEVGQSTEFRVDVVGARADRPPAVPTVAGVNLVYSGQSYSFQFDANTLTRTITTSYVYSVEATLPGRYVIPGLSVMVEGQALHTGPVTLTVVGNGAAGATARQTFVELLIPKKTAYLGESIPVEVRTYFSTNIRAQLTADLVLNGEGFSVAKFTPQKDIGQQAIEGGNYLVAAAKSAVTGLRIGTLSVGPVEVDPVVQLPRTRSRRRLPYNDPFDAFFNNNMTGLNFQPPQQIKLLAEPVPVEIIPLPAPGKPADFSGAIGQFRLESEAEPRQAQAGDPVTVHLKLSGKGNFDRVNAPRLKDEKGLRTYPASARFKADDEVGLSGVKTFDQVVIADGARTTLPPYTFNYFDPVTGKYFALETPPLAVRVEGGNLVTPVPGPALAAGGATPSTPTPAPPPPPPRRAEDILYIRNDPDALRGHDAFRPLYAQRGFWLAQGGGLAVLLGIGAAGFLRTRARQGAALLAAQRQRRQAELQGTLQQVDTGRRDFYAAATGLAQLRAAAAAGSPAAAPSAQEICRDRRLDPPTAAALETMFRRHEEFAYSGGPAAQEPVPPDERLGVLAVLEKLNRGPQA